MLLQLGCWLALCFVIVMVADKYPADVQELANAVYAKLQSWVDQFVYKR